MANFNEQCEKRPNRNFVGIVCADDDSPSLDTI